MDYYFYYNFTHKLTITKCNSSTISCFYWTRPVNPMQALSKFILPWENISSTRFISRNRWTDNRNIWTVVLRSRDESSHPCTPSILHKKKRKKKERDTVIASLTAAKLPSLPLFFLSPRLFDSRVNRSRVVKRIPRYFVAFQTIWILFLYFSKIKERSRKEKIWN